MNKFFRKLLALAGGFLLVFFLWHAPVFAGTLKDALPNLGAAGSGFGGQPGQEPIDPAVLVGKIINIFLTVIGAVFFLLMLYGGYQWMMARGDTDKVTKAKGLITDAIIGLIVVFSAYALTYFIVRRIGEATS